MQLRSEGNTESGDLQLAQAIGRSRQFYNLEKHLQNIKDSKQVALTKNFQKTAFQSDEYFRELQYPMLCDNDKLASQNVGVSMYLYFIKLMGLLLLVMTVIFFGPYQLILIDQKDPDNQFWQSQISLSAFFSLKNITFTEEFKRTGKQAIDSDIEEGRLRTILTMEGSFDDFYVDNNKTTFTTKLSQSLVIPVKNIDLIEVYSGSIVTVYDLVQDENLSLDQLNAQQLARIANGYLDLGYPVIDVATESRNGTKQEIIKDGIVEAEGYWRVVITPTETNAGSGLRRMPKKCDNETEIYLNDFQECKKCEKYWYPAADNLKCIQDECSFYTEIQLENGRCKTCEDYTKPYHTICLSDSCDQSTEYLAIDGSCRLCPDYTHPDSSKDFKECTAEYCGPREITLSSGYCQECPPYKLPSGELGARYECVDVACNKSQVYSNNGNCRTCLEFTHPSEDGSKCITDECDYSLQILGQDGRCQDCELYQYPDQQGRQCLTDSCDQASQILLPSGKCKDCDITYYPDEDNLQCIRQDCSGERLIWQDDGYCQTCLDYTHPDDQKRNCISDICSENEILVQNGTCQACPDFFHPDDQQRVCIQDICNFTEEIIQLNGFCLKCAPYSYPSIDGKSCIQVDCDPETEVMDINKECQPCDEFFYPNEEGTQCRQDVCVVYRNGSCIPCPVFSRPSLDFKECITDDCNPLNEYKKMNGTCQKCEPYTFPAINGYECDDPQCDRSREYLDLETQSCVKCEDFSFPNNVSYFGCISEECMERQFLNLMGKCEVCQNYTHPDPLTNNRSCISDPCNFEFEILTVNGSCKECDPYFYPDSDKKVCLDAGCDRQVQIAAKGSSLCQDCPDYTYPDPNTFNYQCIADDCDFETQIILKSGVCNTCEPYSRPDSLNHNCISDDCQIDTEIILIDGTCFACPPYFYPDESGKQCLDAYCLTDQQILNSANTCEFCPEYTYPNAQGIECISDTCDLSNQVQARNGSCATCQDYTYPDHEARACKQDKCDAYSQIILIDGTCGDCPPYTQPDQAFGRECVPLNCDNQTQYVDSNNFCRTCFRYTYPNATGDGCTFDACNEIQILLENGRCQDCSFSFPDSQGKACIKENCDYTLQILTDRGRCQSCPSYTYPKPISSLYLDSKECSFDSCTNEQIILPNGRCRRCDENFEPDVTGKECHFKLSVQHVTQQTYKDVSDLPTIGQYAVRTTLSMDGTLDEFYGAGGEEVFTSSLSSELGIDQEQIQIQTIQEGSIVVTYDLVAENDTQLSELVSKQTETMATKQINLGFPLLKVSTESFDGTQSDLIDDGTVVAEDFPQVIITLTETNKNLSSSLEILPSNCKVDSQIILEKGGCKTCGKYFRPDPNNTRCIQDSCDFSSQILNDDGTCQTCGDYSYLDLQRMVCETDKCDLNRQIIKVDGTCEDCPNYKYADSLQRQCIQETCDFTKQILKDDGKCQSCEGRSHPDSEKKSCVQCEDYFIPNQEGTECFDAGCDKSTQFLSSESTEFICIDCQQYSFPLTNGSGCECSYSYLDSNKQTCVKEVCSDNQIINTTGKCEDCQLYTYSAPTNSTYLESRDCISDNCGPFEILSENGTCRPCDTYFLPDSNGTSCKELTCNKTTQIYDKDGICSTCDEYYYPHEQGLNCTQDTCDFDTEILLLSGTCQKCEYSYPDASGKQCISDDCRVENGQITLANGRCEQCPYYFYPDETGRVCEDGECDAARQIHQNDTCVDCDEYFYANITDCVQEQCDYEKQIIQKTGKCLTCDEFTRVDESQKECIFDECEFTTQILIEGGFCKTCDPYSYPDEAGRSCVKVQCDQIRYILQDKSCKECNLYTYPDADGKQCIFDTCTSDEEASQILLPSGKCQRCPDYFYVDQNGTKCIYDECDDSLEIVNSKGKCEKCPEYFYPRETDQEYQISRDCIQDNCSGIERLLFTGKCMACPFWNKASEDGLTCIDAQCNQILEILSPSGSCTRCGFGFYPNTDGTECISDFCDPLTEILQINGKCSKCPDFTHPDETLRSCVADKCDYVVERNVLNGTCEACPPYFYPSDSKTACVLSECDPSRNTYIRQECESCGDYKYPDQEGKTCLTDSCDEEDQILNKFGKCDTCEKYTHPDDSNLACVTDLCLNQTQIILENGRCQTCGDYRHPGDDNLACIFDACDNSTQILTLYGTCSTCEQFQHPDSLNILCITDECDYISQILKEDGRCEECPDYSHPDWSSNNLTCVTDTCRSYSQYLAKNGTCQYCPDFSRPNDEFKECIKDECNYERDIQNIDGTCSTCADFTYPNSANTRCIVDRCDESIQILKSDGRCFTCNEFQRPDRDNRRCIDDKCEAITQIFIPGGYCQTCDTYKRADDAQRECFSEACDNSTQILLTTGFCQSCDYSRPDSDNLKCIKDNCENETQILERTGFCTTCANQTRPDQENRNCIQDTCSQTQIYTPDGYCSDCSELYRSNEGKTQCINDFDQCLETQYLSSTGFCLDCEVNFRATSEKTGCFNDLSQCSSTQFLNSSGYCTNCDLYFRANEDKTGCITDECGSREFKDTTGVCSECAEYTYPAADTYSCIADTCTENQTLQIDGTCLDDPSDDSTEDSSDESSDDGSSRRLEERRTLSSKTKVESCQKEGEKCLTQKQKIQQISFWHFVSICCSFLILYHLFQILLFTNQRSLQSKHLSPSDFTLSLQNLHLPQDTPETPSNISNFIRDFLRSTHKVSGADIAYILPCFDIDEYWKFEHQAVQLEQNLRDEQSKVERVNKMLEDKQKQMRKATFNHQEEQLVEKDELDSYEDALNAEEQGGSKEFVKVKSKKVSIPKRNVVQKPQSNGLEEIVSVDDQDPYDEQHSGGEQEFEHNSVRSIRQNRLSYVQNYFQQEDWMEDKFTGHVFVVFNSIKTKQRIIFTQNKLIPTLKFTFARIQSMITSKYPYPSLQDFQDCDEPEGVLWQKFIINPNRSAIKQFFTIYIWSILLMVGQAISMFIVKQRIEDVDQRLKRSDQFYPLQLPFALAKTLIIVIFNKAQDYVLEKMISKNGEHVSMEKRLSRLTIDLVVVKIITTCFITLTVFSVDNGESYNPIAYLVINDDFVLTILLTIFFQGFILPLIQVAYPGRILRDNKRKVLTERRDKGIEVSISQDALDKMVKGEEIGMHFRISDFVALVVTSLIISPLVPVVLPMTLLGSIAHYWANKYVILRKCEIEMFSTKNLTFKILRKTIWLISLQAFSFLYIWTKINGEFFDFYDINALLSTSFLQSQSLLPAFLALIIFFQAFVSPFLNNRIFHCIDAIQIMRNPSQKYHQQKSSFNEIFSTQFIHDYMRDYPLTRDQGTVKQQEHLMALEASKSQVTENVTVVHKPPPPKTHILGNVSHRNSQLEQSDERALVGVEGFEMGRRQTEVVENRQVTLR